MLDVDIRFSDWGMKDRCVARMNCFLMDITLGRDKISICDKYDFLGDCERSNAGSVIDRKARLFLACQETQGAKS